MWKQFFFIATVLIAGLSPAWAISKGKNTEPNSVKSNLSDKAIPLQIEAVPKRPKPLLELGNPFLGRGHINKGFELPTGAVWQPSLLIFGTFRNAIQTFDNGKDPSTSEWANRLDLFANIALSGTERIIIGLRPLDDEGMFSGFDFEADRNDGWQDELNADIETFFFEGDFGEIFPNLDPSDFGSFDIGFSIGRQPFSFQEGMLINDTFDAVGFTRNNLQPTGTSNLRLTFLYGWDGIHRDDNTEDKSAQLLALLTETDFYSTTVNVDTVYIAADDDTGNAFYAGISAVQRMGHINTAFRVNTSVPSGKDTSQTRRGTLLFAEVSRTLPHGDDLVYFNAFWGIDHFSSAARGPTTGGPLGRTGILFAAVGLGQYGAPLGNQADDAIGGSMGYQTFFGNQYLTRKQLILEIGGRRDTDNTDQEAGAIGVRYQQAVGRRIIIRFDSFAAAQVEREAYGARLECLVKF